MRRAAIEKGASPGADVGKSRRRCGHAGLGDDAYNAGADCGNTVQMHTMDDRYRKAKWEWERGLVGIALSGRNAKRELG